MGNKIWVVGVTMIFAAPLLPIPAVLIVGQVLAVIGCVLLVMDK